MNELDREMILAQRGEERDAAIERRRNAKMAAQAQQAAIAVGAHARDILPWNACISLQGLRAAMIICSAGFDSLIMHRSLSCGPNVPLIRKLWSALFAGGGRRADAVVDAGEAAGPRQEGRPGGAAGRAQEKDPAQRVSTNCRCTLSPQSVPA